MLTVNKKELFLKRFLYVCAAIYVLTLAAGFYMNFVKKDYEALGMTLVACITPLIVPIGFKLLKLKPVYEIYIISTIFVYFASLIGSGLAGIVILDLIRCCILQVAGLLQHLPLFCILRYEKQTHLKKRNILHCFWCLLMQSILQLQSYGNFMNMPC